MQFLTFAFIGIVRGYSMQPQWSFRVSLFGAPLVFLVPRCKPLLFLPLTLTIYFGILTFLAAGRMNHRRAGYEYSWNGQYQAAMKEFENASESKRWYLRMSLFSKSHEDMVLLQIARTSCQLADFDRARDAYKRILNRYPDSKRTTLTKEYLQKLEDGLKKVAKYNGQTPETKEDLDNLYDIAKIYRLDLNCKAKALEIYRNIVDMEIDETGKTLAKKHIETLTKSR